MRSMLLAAVLVGAASVLTTSDAMADHRPAAEPAPTDRGRTSYDERSTKQGSANQRSAKRGSNAQLPLGSGVPTRAAANALLRLPDDTLLTPPPEFDRAPKATDLDGARGQPQPSPTAQTGPSTDAALRMKLDYERQCYRHVTIILRDQLLKLQASVGSHVQVSSQRSETDAQASLVGSYVQVSSVRRETDAQASFRALQSKYPKVLGDKQAVIRRAELGGKGVYYRAMVGPFASIEKAAELCSSLKAAGGACFLQRN
jgi:SPOR domain